MFNLKVLYPSLNTEAFDAVLGQLSATTDNEAAKNSEGAEKELANHNRVELDKSKNKK